jgi:hypothetical protein
MIAGGTAIVGALLLMVGKQSEIEGPRFELIQVMQYSGKQSARFLIFAPTNNAVVVEFHTVVGEQGRRSRGNPVQSSPPGGTMVKSNQVGEATILAPGPGVWRARFICYSYPQRKGYRLWRARLAHAWKHRTFKDWQAIPWTQEWIIDSDPITNTVSEVPYHP